VTDKLDKGTDDARPATVVSKDDGPAPGAPAAIKAIPVRHYGRWVSAVIVLALVGLIVNAFATADKIQWQAVGDYVLTAPCWPAPAGPC